MKHCAFVFFILVFSLEDSIQKLSIKEDTMSFAASDCILYILKKYFHAISKMSVRFQPTEHTDIVSNFIKNINLKEYKFPVVINADEIPQIHGIERRMPNQVHILMDESVNITKMLNRTLWTAQTQFIVVISNQSKIDNTFVLQQFWLHNINNVIVLVVEKADVHIHSFIPFNKFDCNIKPILLATWSSGVLTNSTGIINRPIQNLNGCLLNITVVDLPPTVIFKNRGSRNGTDHIDGIEASILTEISKILNFKPRFAVARDGQAWGWIEPAPHGVVGEVYQRKSQIGCGLLAFTLERYEYLDTSVSTSCNTECITWAVPLGAGRASATWIAIFVTEFPSNVWCLILAAWVSTVMAYRILSIVSGNERYLFQHNVRTILYVFQSFLGIAYKVPKDTVLRIVFLSSLWYSFIILTAYQSSMRSKLTVPFQKPDINTFRDLLESDLHFTGFYNTFRLVLNGDQEGDVKEIANRLEATDYGITEAVEKIVYDRNIAYMRESTTFMYNAMINPSAKGLVHIMNQCVYTYYPVMVLQKRYPLTSRVNRIARRLFETGLICKWRSKYLYDVPQPPPTVVKLSINHMKGIFLVFGIGIGVAVVAFCAEHIHYRMTSRQSKRHDEK